MGATIRPQLLAIMGLGLLSLFLNPVNASDCNVTQFHLYERGQETRKDACDLKCSTVKSTAIVIHGFNTDETSYIWRVKEAVFENFKHVDNVVEVDWQKSSQRHLWEYANVVKDTLPKVYDEVLGLMELLHNRGCHRIIMIGHSLGAHASGKAARMYKAAYNNSVDLIIGLDPAGPNYDKKFSIGFTVSTRFRRAIVGGYYSKGNSAIFGYAHLFESTNYNWRQGLSKGDAKRVYVVHTDYVCLGIETRIGDIDIYPNDGFGQPGCCFIFCPPAFLGCWYTSGCSHNYAIRHFGNDFAGRVLNAYPDLGLSEVSSSE